MIFFGFQCDNSSLSLLLGKLQSDEREQVLFCVYGTLGDSYMVDIGLICWGFVFMLCKFERKAFNKPAVTQQCLCYTWGFALP